MTPLLEVAGARIEYRDSTLWDGLSFSVSGRRVGLFGQGFSSFFRLLTGDATLGSGRVSILGGDAKGGVREGTVGLALSDVALPDDFRVKELFVERARLAGVGYWHARSAAGDALGRLGMTGFARRKLRALNDTERRAVVIASATVTRPEVLVLEEPFAGLDDVAAASIGALIDRASSERSLILGTSSDAAIGVEAAFVSRLDAVCVLHEGVVVSGAPSKVLSTVPRFLVWVEGATERFLAALEQRGLRVEASAAHDRGSRLIVTMPGPADTAPILEAALEVSAPILRLIPVAIRPSSHVNT